VNLDANVRNAEFRALPFAVRAGLHTDRSTEAAETAGREMERTGRMGYINDSTNAGESKTSGKGSV